MSEPTKHSYGFGPFRLDTGERLLFRDGEIVPLPPKIFDTLLALVEGNGHLLDKDELIKQVWPDTFVEEGNLTRNVSTLRSVLGEGENGHHYIETIPRRGYRFVASVTELMDEVADLMVQERTRSSVTIEEETSPGILETARESAARSVGMVAARTSSSAEYLAGEIKRHTRATILALSTFLLVIAVVAAWRLNAKQSIDKNATISPAVQKHSQLFQNVEITSLTHTGNIDNNALSPDGKYVAYTTSDAGLETLWLRQIATNSTHLIIPTIAARYFGVTFSRDGNYIFYLRAETNNPLRVVYRIPSLGGVPEKLMADMDWCPTLSPDGSQFAFVRNSESDSESVLMIANVDGSNERKLAVRPLHEHYTFPAWSPDGQVIACSAGSTELGDSYRDVVEVRVADGAEKTLTTRKWYWIGRLAWLADGSGLVMSANPEKSHVYAQLWVLSLASGEACRITNDSRNYSYVSLSADSRALLTSHPELLTHLWIAPEGDAARARRVTSGLGDYRHIRWTADGKLTVTAFGSNHIDIWLRDPDSNAARQLTANAGTNWGQAVSPDGRYIIFDSDRTGSFHIWRMETDGTNPVQLTNGSGEKFADISPDGKWVAYTSFPDRMLSKVPINGGEPVQIVRSPARESAISPDGKWIAYSTLDQEASPRFRSVMIVPFTGGSPVTLFDLPPNALAPQWVRWSPDSRAVLFIVNKKGVGNIWQQPLDGGPPQQVTHFNTDRVISYDWSRDGKHLAVVRGAWTADMVLLKQK